MSNLSFLLNQLKCAILALTISVKKAITTLRYKIEEIEAVNIDILTLLLLLWYKITPLLLTKRIQV